MRHCQNCGSELREQAKICNTCQYPIPADGSSLADGSPAKELHSGDAPTVISEALLPTFLSKRSEEDTPTITGAVSPTAFSQEAQQRYSTQWDNQDDLNEEGRTTPFYSDSFLLAPTLNEAGNAPMVQGTPQASGLPILQGTPSMSPPPPAFGSQNPEAVWNAQGAHPPFQVPPSQGIGKKPPTRRLNETIEKVTSYLQARTQIKSAKILVFIALILILLVGSGGILVLDEALEKGEQVGFLQFDENFEHQSGEALFHGRAHATATANSVIATATVGTNQLARYEQQTRPVVDSLSQNNKTHPWLWTLGYPSIPPGRDCSFQKNGYHIVESHSNDFYYCIAQKTDIPNFAFQVDMTLGQGGYGGIVFRSTGRNHYVFRIGQDGTYALKLYTDDKGETLQVLASGSSSAIRTVVPHSNTLTVVAHGPKIELYVNGTYLTTVNNNQYLHGDIGLEAEDHGATTEAVFSNANLWKLP